MIYEQILIYNIERKIRKEIGYLKLTVKLIPWKFDNKCQQPVEMDATFSAERASTQTLLMSWELTWGNKILKIFSISSNISPEALLTDHCIFGTRSFLSLPKKFNPLHL